MADDQGEHYNFDLELYCIVCDRQIDPTSSPLPTTINLNPPSAPSPSPRLSSPSAHTSPAPPNSTPSSSRSHNAPLSAPKLKRTGSGHSNASNGAVKQTGTTGGLKRNKSLGKIHHHAAGGAHRRNHSHANLHALAPMTNETGGGGGKGKRVTVTGVGPAAEKVNTKQAAKELEREREKERAKEEASTRHFDSASTLYCSEECKQIDEARNQLTITHLGGSESSSPAPFPLSSPSQATSRSDDFDEEEEPCISLARRRSSGMSSTGSTSYTFSSTGERGLSPIMSAAPTSNPSPYIDSSGFPFPSVSTTSTPLAHNHSHTNMHSHPSNSSLNSLPSQQSYQGAPPLLNFSSRRQSRGAHSSGAYSYRPSLMERVHSTDSNDSGVSDRGMSRGARSLSITGGFSAGLFNRVKSMDGLSMLGKSDSETSDREGRQANSHRQNSALSSLRSMTPISNAPPMPSPNRSRPPLANNRYSEPSSSSLRDHERPSATRISSDSQAASQSRSRSRSRKPPQSGLPHRARSRPPPTTSPLIAGSDPPPPIVGSLPAQRSRGLSLDSPTSTTSLLRPVPVSPNPLLASRRTSSSASLALLGSSLSKSHDHRSGLTNPWIGPKRSDSTAGLSGLVAMGEISAPSASTSPFPPSSSSTTSTFIPAPSTFSHRHHPPPHSQRPRRPSSSHSHPHSSPSSATSSFAHSHSSVRTSSSSRRSTAASSDHWQGVVSSSLGSNPSHSSGMHRTRSGSSSRPDRPSTGTSATGERGGGGSNRVKQGGLTMTPSHTNLPAIAPPSPTPRTHSTLAPPIPSASSNAPSKQNLGGGQMTGGSRTWSWTNLHVPTYQALDVGEFRAKKERDEKVAVPGGDRNGGETALPPQQQQRKDRKRLFHFADTGDAESS